jgi:hypothetical protein
MESQEFEVIGIYELQRSEMKCNYKMKVMTMQYNVKVFILHYVRPKIL